MVCDVQAIHVVKWIGLQGFKIMELREAYSEPPFLRLSRQMATAFKVKGL